jgi:hypothetical protein
MHVLLLSMPDSFEHMPSLAIRMPNGALTSLAGNLDVHHQVAVADLILVQSRVRETVERLVRELRPNLVGLSVMTFQRRTALRLIAFLRTLRPQTQFVRWRAERWLKVRHLPAALLHSPGFAVRHGMRILAHTFRGSSLRSLVGLEDERKAFARYRAIRKAERTYV